MNSRRRRLICSSLCEGRIARPKPVVLTFQTCDGEGRLAPRPMGRLGRGCARRHIRWRPASRPRSSARSSEFRLDSGRSAASRAIQGSARSGLIPRSIGDRELVAPGKFLDCRHEPRKELMCA
jgi:hypothetical protein